jgi:hypothetical protein
MNELKHYRILFVGYCPIKRVAHGAGCMRAVAANADEAAWMFTCKMGGVKENPVEGCLGPLEFRLVKMECIRSTDPTAPPGMIGSDDEDGPSFDLGVPAY